MDPLTLEVVTINSPFSFIGLSVSSWLNIQAAKNKFDQHSDDKEPFNFVLRSIIYEKERIWSSAELIQVYRSKGGTETNRSRFIDRIQDHLKDQVYCFKAIGVNTVIMHCSKAASLVKLTKVQDEDNFADTKK